MLDNVTLTKEARPSIRRKNQISSFSGNHNYDLLVFCHLRWDFVYQRPQHIISRLAQDYKILFVEEPTPNPEPGHSLRVLSANLHVFRPNISAMEDLPGALDQILTASEIPLAWFYSPSFIPVLKEMKFGNVIYDCMDELSLFKGAPASLIQQERHLMSNSDVVFTGGRSLFESKMSFHSNVHCFPSSVDFEHFAKAKNGVSLPADIASIPSPIVGYFGVIDERLDLELIEKTASKLPNVSFVFIGPVVKISESDLPKLPNIYYLGMKSYQTLPNYLKAFTVAMMPFALNDATKFISPTKTLEYMAAGKPIVSTRIKDVEREYSTCVHLISDDQDFVEVLQRILTPKNDGIQDSESYEDILKNTSWNSTVNKMKLAIAELKNI